MKRLHDNISTMLGALEGVNAADAILLLSYTKASVLLQLEADPITRLVFEMDMAEQTASALQYLREAHAERIRRN